MKILSLLLLLNNIQAFAEYGFEKIAITRAEDERNYGFTDLRTNPSINDEGDVVFWANTPSGEKLYISEVSQTLKTYLPPRVISSRSQIKIDEFDIPSPIINNRKEVAFAAGSRGITTLQIKGCGLPKPSEVLSKRVKINSSTEVPIPPGSEKMLSFLKKITPKVSLEDDSISSLNSVKQYKINTQGFEELVNYPGKVSCSPNLIKGDLLIKKRFTSVGVAESDMSLNNRGDLVFLSYFYREDFIYDSSSGELIGYGTNYTYGIVRKLDGQNSKIIAQKAISLSVESPPVDSQEKLVLNHGSFPMINDFREVVVNGYSSPPQGAVENENIYVIYENGAFQPVIQRKLNLVSPFNNLNFTHTISNTGNVFFSGTKNNGIGGYFVGRYSADSPVNDFSTLASFEPEGTINGVGIQYPAVASQIDISATDLRDKIIFGYGRAPHGFSLFGGVDPNAEYLFGKDSKLDDMPPVRLYLGRRSVNNFGRAAFGVVDREDFDGSPSSPQVRAIYVANRGTYVGTPDCGSDGLACLDLPPFNSRGAPINSCFEACASEGYPVNVGTGAMWHPEIDFSLPGRTGDLKFVRTYLNLPGATAGDFGPNWHHNFETKLVSPNFRPNALQARNIDPISDADLMWIDENGGAWLLRFSQITQDFVLPSEMKATFSSQPEYYELVKRDKTIYRFHRARDRKFGKILEKIDRYGEAQTFTYDNLGNLSSISYPMAGTLYFARDGAGRVIQIHRTRDGLNHSYEYDSNGRLSRVTHFDGATSTYQYNSNQVGKRAHGMLQSITDPLNRTLQFFYYDNGKASRQVEAAGGVFQFSYEGNKTTVRRPDGGKVIYYQDSDFRTVKKILADGTREYTSWSDGGFKASEGREHGGITRFEYDQNGNLTSLQLPGNNAPSRFSYDPTFNKLLSIEPLVGARTNFFLSEKGDFLVMERGGLGIEVQRDAFGNITSTSNNFGTYTDQRNGNGQITFKYDAHNPETRTYDSIHRLKTRSFASGQLLTYSYDSRDRVTNIQDNQGPDRSFVYDIMGKVLESRVGDGANKQVTTFTYDSRDRIRQIKNALNEITTYNYDPARVMDKPSSITDAAGRTTTFTYDKLVRLVRKQEPNGAVTKFTYDVNDRLTSVEDANGQVTRYSYDMNGNKIKEVRPSVAGNTASSYEIEFYYDLDNRLVKKRHVSKRGYNHREEEFTYDGLDRLTRKLLKVEKSSGFEVQDDANYSYLSVLEANALTKADNWVAKLDFNRIGSPPFSISSYEVEATQSGNPLGLIEGNFSIGRDVTGEIATISQNGINIFTKQYDPAGRLTQVQSGNLTINLGYDSFGRKASQSSSDAATGSWAYDLLNRITNINWTGPTPISQQLTYDLAGNITNLARENGSYTLGYDGNDQLISSSGLENRSYVYDALGNRLQDSINGPGEFVNNFLKQNSVSTFLADQEGFGEVAKETTSTQEKNYTYRADGKISGYQSGNLSVQYFYDGLDRLVAKAINEGNQYTQTFTHLEDENRVLLGKAGDNSITTYIDGQGMAERIAEVKGGIGKAYVTDHLGSVLNSAVAGVAKSFGLWGEIAQAPQVSPSSAPLNYGFTGHFVDTESGLNRTMYRQYDSKSGRWWQQDPIGYVAGDPNNYRYVINNPIKYKDPTGLWCEYSQSSGNLQCFDNDTGDQYLGGQGYSGTGVGRDNPDAEIIRNVGPIPRGIYSIGDAEDRTGSQGPNVRPLTPLSGTFTYGRSGFLIHGNNIENDASTGCVIAPPDIRTGIRNGELLYVYE